MATQVRIAQAGLLDTVFAAAMLWICFELRIFKLA